MKLIGELNAIDVAFLPIGDNFTMGIKDATIAAKWLQAKTVVPIHYDTFPVIEVDPYEFVNGLEKGQGKVVKPGGICRNLKVGFWPTFFVSLYCIK